MTLRRKFPLVPLIGVGGAALLMVMEVSGQDKPQVVPAERPKPEFKAPGLRPSDAVKPAKPAAPETLESKRDAKPEVKAGASAEIKVQLDAFKNARDAYLAKQRELSEQMRGAPADRRRDVQLQLETLRREWFDRSRSFREEAQKRMPDLRDLPRYEALGKRPPINDSK